MLYYYKHLCLGKDPFDKSGFSKFKSPFPLAVAEADYVGIMASTDVHVRICEQEILKYDLEIKALIQVRIFPW